MSTSAKEPDYTHVYLPADAVNGKLMVSAFIKKLKRSKDKALVDELRQRLKTVSYVQDITVRRTSNVPPDVKETLLVPYSYLQDVQPDERVFILFTVVTQCKQKAKDKNKHDRPMVNAYIVGSSHRLANATLLADVMRCGQTNEEGKRLEEDQKMVRIRDLSLGLSDVVDMLRAMGCKRKINGVVVDDDVPEMQHGNVQNNSGNVQQQQVIINAPRPLLPWESLNKEEFNPEPYTLHITGSSLQDAIVSDNPAVFSRSELLKLAYKRVAMLTIILEYGLTGSTKAIQMYHDMLHDVAPLNQSAAQWLVCISASVGEGYSDLMLEAEIELIRARYALLKDKEERLLAFRANQVELDVERLQTEFEMDPAAMLAEAQHSRLTEVLQLVENAVGTLSYGEFSQSDELGHPPIPYFILEGTVEIPQRCFESILPCVDLWVNAARTRSNKQTSASQ